MRKAGLAVAVLVALFLGALPAHAGTYEWKDDEGDATGVGLADGVLPSQDQFDITKVSLASDGKTFTYAATLKDVAAGTPDYATGYYFRLGFSYAGTAYWFLVSEDVTAGAAFRIAPQDTTDTATMPCDKCTGKIDRKKKQVIVTAPLTSLNAAIKADDKTKPPVAAGSEITDLKVLAQRPIGVAGRGATLTADDATASTGFAFKL